MVRCGRWTVKDVDFLRAILETSILYVDLIEQPNASEGEAKPVKFGFCKCSDCEQAETADSCFKEGV